MNTLPNINDIFCFHFFVALSDRWHWMASKCGRKKQEEESGEKIRKIYLIIWIEREVLSGKKLTSYLRFTYEYPSVRLCPVYHVLAHRHMSNASLMTSREHRQQKRKTNKNTQRERALEWSTANLIKTICRLSTWPCIVYALRVYGGIAFGLGAVFGNQIDEKLSLAVCVRLPKWRVSHTRMCGWRTRDSNWLEARTFHRLWYIPVSRLHLLHGPASDIRRNVFSRCPITNFGGAWSGERARYLSYVTWCARTIDQPKRQACVCVDKWKSFIKSTNPSATYKWTQSIDCDYLLLFVIYCYECQQSEQQRAETMTWTKRWWCGGLKEEVHTPLNRHSSDTYRCCVRCMRLSHRTCIE